MPSRNGEPECRDLRALLSGLFIQHGSVLPPEVVGTVVFARRVVKIEFDTSAEGRATGSNLSRWFGGFFTAKVAAGTTEQNTLIVASTKVAPVAYKSVMIPVERTVGATLGGGEQRHAICQEMGGVRPWNPRPRGSMAPLGRARSVTRARHWLRAIGQSFALVIPLALPLCVATDATWAQPPPASAKRDALQSEKAALTHQSVI